MDPNFTKLSAWLILAAGLSLIGWTVFSSYDFFMGKKDFPQVFKPAEQGEVKKVQQNQEIAVLPKDSTEAQIFLQNQAEKIAMENISNIFPEETIFQFINMASWTAFATFLIFAGGQISGLGIKLLTSKA
ncbi:MAG: hypothetical protein WCX23_03145 [Candidatus Paceibacterota bacterium]|jgi:hypothetical protein